MTPACPAASHYRATETHVDLKRSIGFNLIRSRPIQYLLKIGLFTFKRALNQLTAKKSAITRKRVTLVGVHPVFGPEAARMRAPLLRSSSFPSSEAISAVSAPIGIEKYNC